MPIYKYQKVSDQYATYTLNIEQGQTHQELATIDGDTFHWVDGALAQQPEQITVVEATLTDHEKSVIKAHSAACKYIDGLVVQKIRQSYSIDDELKCLRLAGSEEFEIYNAHVEACRQWGRDKKAAYGL